MTSSLTPDQLLRIEALKIAAAATRNGESERRDESVARAEAYLAFLRPVTPLQVVSNMRYEETPSRRGSKASNPQRSK